jgi:LmbE family N-acetylglucosaminyl deacetylase
MDTIDEQIFPPLEPKVVLGIAAHADDLDFGAGGSMARFARDGAAVHYLILTDGSKGSADTAIAAPELIKQRETEQRAALGVLGGQTVTFLGYPDSGLEVTQELKKAITKVIRQLKPDLVVTWDPSLIYSAKRGFINHPDHRAAGQAALDAVFPLARDHMSFPELYAEGFQPHITPHVLLMNFDSPNYFVDTTDTFEQKIETLKAHVSQVTDLDRFRAMFDEMSTAAGSQAGYGRAEGFVRIDIR